MQSKGGIDDFRKVISGDLPHFEQEKIYVDKDGGRIPARVQSYLIYKEGEEPSPENVLYSFSLVIFNESNQTSESLINSLLRKLRAYEARQKSYEAKQRTTDTELKSLKTMVESFMAMSQKPVVVKIDNDNRGGDQSIEQKGK